MRSLWWLIFSLAALLGATIGMLIPIRSHRSDCLTTYTSYAKDGSYTVRTVCE